MTSIRYRPAPAGPTAGRPYISKTLTRLHDEDMSNPSEWDAMHAGDDGEHGGL